MNIEKISQLIRLLSELQEQEFYNETNLLEDEGINLDLFSCTDLLMDYLQKNYIMKNINAWSIKK